MELVVGGNIAGTAILVGEDAVAERHGETGLALENELELCSQSVAALKAAANLLQLARRREGIDSDLKGAIKGLRAATWW